MACCCCCSQVSSEFVLIDDSSVRNDSYPSNGDWHVLYGIVIRSIWLAADAY
jgi:hypothetical protein